MLLDVKQIKNNPQKLPVNWVTTGALAANTYANGTSGSGATLTANSNGAMANQDGVAVTLGQRGLVKNEATGANNGIYIVTQVGDASHPYILTRASDSDTATKTFPGITVTSTAEGTANKSREWVLTTTGALTIGTTAQTWALVTDTTANVPTSSNKSMTASVTTADFQSACATALAATPTNGGYVQVFVNGSKQTLGDAVKTKDCYFSSDGGTTAKAISALASGDVLYWVGSVAGYQLAASDIIDFDFVN